MFSQGSRKLSHLQGTVGWVAAAEGSFAVDHPSGSCPSLAAAAVVVVCTEAAACKLETKSEQT